MPSNPQELFDNHHLEWADDFAFDAQRRSVLLTNSQLRTMVLIDIKQRLNARDRDLKHFRLKEPTDEDLKEVAVSETNKMSVLIREELDFDSIHLSKLVDERKTSFTKSQRKVFDLVMQAASQDSTLYVYIDARGGTGKTFVLNAILAAVRVMDGGSIGLGVGSTDIAANLFHLGHTFHSRFKVPLNIKQDSICNIDVQK